LHINLCSAAVCHVKDHTSRAVGHLADSSLWTVVRLGDKNLSHVVKSHQAFMRESFFYWSSTP